MTNNRKVISTNKEREKKKKRTHQMGHDRNKVCETENTTKPNYMP